MLPNRSRRNLRNDGEIAHVLMRNIPLKGGRTEPANSQPVHRKIVLNQGCVFIVGIVRPTLCTRRWFTDSSAPITSPLIFEVIFSTSCVLLFVFKYDGRARHILWEV